ncbi:Outer membrane efflux protein [Candidatus Sulfotelmatobacter kueseliae]|uniref:Outer membrane efflux protein n=1 Tax=Candidatus Sulfotelmatobacter kueseliae TaxID=2042962 RepID=A0A2U3JY47_9BACT|nr:Outer membrane efflux protein [Candidatus Sulfotelmatobacter kueseliae]
MRVKFRTSARDPLRHGQCALISTRIRSRHLRILAAAAMFFLLLVGAGSGQNTTLISLDQAIDLALAHNHSIKATRTLILQNQAQEITANLRPNPTFGADTQFVPFFSPQDFSGENLNETQQFDIGVGYLFERGHKRQRRLQAARDQTAITRAQVTDAERALVFNVGQQFVSVLLAESTLQFALQDLKSFQETVDISEAQLKAGSISEGDYLKIKLQLLQFQTDVSAARLAKVQALVGLREFLGYNAVPADYDVIGDLAYQPLQAKVEDLQMKALRERPDFRAAELGITAAQSQILLAKANAKVDVNGTYDFTHVSGENTASLFVNFELPIFNRNQGEIARTGYALTQAQEQEQAASDTVLSDVANAYEAVRSNDEVVQLYTSGYLKQAQDSRDISEYAYRRGAASLLDFLDAERSYRYVQLAYRQALASYMTALEQLKQAVGTRNLP